MRDINAFRERYKHWKETGELPYKAGRVIEQAEENLPLPTYAGGKNDDDWLLNFVADREGYRKNVYNDTLANNIETIGYGFTDPAVINKYRRTGMSETVAKLILRSELNKRKIKLLQLVPHWNELTPNMQDSLTSYYYNFPFHNDPNSKAKRHYSPKLFKALENRDWLEVARQMDGGINLAKGLRNRRIAELQHFLGNMSLKRPSKTFTQPSLILELEELEKWLPNVEYPTQTQYEISQRVPLSISSWSSANSPAPFTRMPDLINIMDAYNKIVNEDSPLSIHKMDKGTEPYIEYVDDVRVNPQTGGVMLSTGDEGSVILPDVTVRPQPKLTNSAFDGYTRYLDDLISFVPIAGDINDGTNAAIALANGNYSLAGLLAAGLLLPNALEKPLKFATKLTKIPNVLKNKYVDFKIDRAYNKAINGRNKEEVRSLIEKLFLRNAPLTTIVENGKPIIIYHGTPNRWMNHKYDSSRFGTSTDDGYFGVGMYGTYDKKHAGIYATGEDGNIMLFYINAKNTFDHGMIPGISSDELNNRAGVVRYFNRKNRPTKSHIDQKLWKELDSSDATNYWYTDGNKIRQFDELVVPDGRQMKLANLITYDDNGKMIPLSKRFNFSIDDIRYNKGKSPIRINPANRGKFNALKRRTGKTTEQLIHSKNPLTRKRAIFALNAKKWNHKKK